MRVFKLSPGWWMAAVWCAATAAHAQGSANTVVYRCPGPPVLYTDAMSATEAKEKNCRTIEGATITVIQGQRPRTVSSSASGSRSSAEGKVEPSQQRARDSDARRILEDELKKCTKE